MPVACRDSQVKLNHNKNESPAAYAAGLIFYLTLIYACAAVRVNVTVSVSLTVAEAGEQV